MGTSQKTSSAANTCDSQAIILLRDEVARLSGDLLAALERLNASTSSNRTQKANEAETLRATIRDLRQQLSDKDRQLEEQEKQLLDMTTEKSHLEQQNHELDLQRKRARTMAWELAVQLDDFLFAGHEDVDARDNFSESTAEKRRWEERDDDSTGTDRTVKLARRSRSSETEGSSYR